MKNIFILVVLLNISLYSYAQKKEEKVKPNVTAEEALENYNEMKKERTLFMSVAINDFQHTAIYLNDELIAERSSEYQTNSFSGSEYIRVDLIKKENHLKVVVNDREYYESQDAGLEVNIERLLTPDTSEKITTIKWEASAEKPSSFMTFEENFTLPDADVALAAAILAEKKRVEENPVFGKNYMFFGNLNSSNIDCEWFVNGIPATKTSAGQSTTMASGSFHNSLKKGTNTISLKLRPSSAFDTANSTIIMDPKVSFIYTKAKPGQFADEGEQLVSIEWKANGNEQYPIELTENFELSEKDFPVSLPWHNAEVITKKDIKKAEELILSIHKHIKTGTLKELSSVFKPAFETYIKANPGTDHFQATEANFYEDLKDLADNQDNEYKLLPINKKDMDFVVLEGLFIQAVNKDGKHTISAVSTTEDENIWAISLLFIKLDGELFVHNYRHQ